MINLDKLAQASVAKEPFPYMVGQGLLADSDLAGIDRDFPDINQSGVFPLSELSYGEAFAKLIDDVQSEGLEDLLGEKFGLDLSSLPLMITVRGMCHKRDGRAHTDSKDKVLTCLLYLNPGSWGGEGGRLRLLRDGKDINSTIAEVPPNGGTFVAFQRTDNSWHGHEPFEGRRRYVMFNWVRSDMALGKNLLRHKISATFKRLGLAGGGY